MPCRRAPISRCAKAPPLGTTTNSSAAWERRRGTGVDNVAAREFRVAAGEFMADLGAPIRDAPPLRMVKLAEMRAKLETSVDPRITIAKGIRDRTVFSTDLVWEPEDPLDEIMAVSEIPAADVRGAARPRAGLAAARPRADRSQHGRARDHQPAHDRGVHGRAQPRDGARAAVERIPDRSARQLLPAVLERGRRGAAKRRSGQAARHSGDSRLDQAPGPRQSQRAPADAEWRRAARAARARRPVPPLSEHRGVRAQGARCTRRGKRTSATDRIDYEFYGKLLPDIAFFGFPLTPTQAVGAADATDASQDQGGSSCCRSSLRSRASVSMWAARSAAPSRSGTRSRGRASSRTRPSCRRSHTSISISSCPDVRALNTGTEPAWHADSGLGRDRCTGRAPGLHHTATARADRDSRVRHAARDALT